MRPVKENEGNVDCRNAKGVRAMKQEFPSSKRFAIAQICVAVALLVIATTVGGQVATAPPAKAASQGGDSPAVKRAKELAEVIGQGNYAKTVQYIKENYSESFLNIPMEAHVEFIMVNYDQSRGVDSLTVQSETADSATVLARSKLTGLWQSVVVRVETDPPYKIKGIGSRPPGLPPGAKTEPRLSDSQIATELDAYMKRLADAGVFSGAVLVAHNGQVLFKQAYGDANKDFDAKNRIDTKFNLGSMNKMFTSIAIAQLIERGKIHSMTHCLSSCLISRQRNGLRRSGSSTC